MKSFFAELKRRNVYKVAVAYAVVAWLLIHAASILFPTFEAPSWVMKVFVTAVILGPRRPEHLDPGIAALELEAPRNDLAALF